MRNVFCRALVDLSRQRPFMFFTGDLGFMALEPLQQAIGPRFINAGLAEQNMVSVAAAFAANGQQAWIYSIAPFIYARPFEQVRNDVCLHDLNVKLVGNGGGYAYGSMGATHHALEDYGSLLTLQNMHAYIPSFLTDVATMVAAMARDPHPAYLRLGHDEKPAVLAVEDYAPWRCIVDGCGPIVVAVGPIAGPLAGAILGLPQITRPQLWTLCELPLCLAPPPAAFLRSIERSGHLGVVEEHVAQGSAGAALALWLLNQGFVPGRFDHFCARGYVSGTYGSQQFHRKECGLDTDSVLKGLA